MREGRYSIYHNGPIAYCGDTSNVPGDGEANARLIASAPALRKALEVYIDEWHAKPANIERMEPASLKAARAALALAKGDDHVRD